MNCLFRRRGKPEARATGAAGRRVTVLDDVAGAVGFLTATMCIHQVGLRSPRHACATSDPQVRGKRPKDDRPEDQEPR
eukprot:gene1092-biopygen9190